MKVLFLANRGPLSASSRTRVFDYLPFLRAGGIEADVRVAIPDRLFAWAGSGARVRRLVYYFRVLWRSFWIGFWTAWVVSHYDVIFVQRVLLPFPIPWILRHNRQKIVFDFDDAIFTFHAPDAGLIARVQTWFHRHSVPPGLRMACHAIVENTYTAAYAARYCPNVSIITGPIDTDRYRPGRRKDRQGVVLGWIGSPTTTPYLKLIRKPLAGLGRRYPDLQLCLIGAGAFEVEGLRVVRLGWSLETEVEDLQRFDIGLMPLPDDPWTRGKGGFKLLQYLSMGIPVVTSPVGINREIVEDGVNGFLAACDEEWAGCLARLIEDAELRRRMGKAGRERVEKRYALKRSNRRLLEILESITNGQQRVAAPHFPAGVGRPG